MAKPQHRLRGVAAAASLTAALMALGGAFGAAVAVECKLGAVRSVGDTTDVTADDAPPPLADGVAPEARRAPLVTSPPSVRVPPWRRAVRVVSPPESPPPLPATTPVPAEPPAIIGDLVEGRSFAPGTPALGPRPTNLEFE